MLHCTRSNSFLPNSDYFLTILKWKDNWLLANSYNTLRAYLRKKNAIGHFVEHLECFACRKVWWHVGTRRHGRRRSMGEGVRHDLQREREAAMASDHELMLAGVRRWWWEEARMPETSRDANGANMSHQSLRFGRWRLVKKTSLIFLHWELRTGRGRLVYMPKKDCVN